MGSKVMAHRYHRIAFTPAVKAVQSAAGSRDAYARLEDGREAGHRLGPAETAFIAERDTFFMASVGATGWPYIQHRGGPPGFVRVLDETTIGFADFAGNRQYVTLGNLEGEDRVALIFLDYANRRRLKLYGRARSVPLDDAAAARLQTEGYRARVERGLLVEVAAFDWNCPQHITPRYTLAEFELATAALTERIGQLEAELARRAEPGSRPESD